MVEAKLAELRQRLSAGDWDQSALADVEEMERQYAEALASEGLLQHFVIADFAKLLQGEVDTMTHVLSEKEKLTAEERADIYRERAIRRRFIDLFTNGGKRLKAAANRIDAALESAREQDAPARYESGDETVD